MSNVKPASPSLCLKYELLKTNLKVVFKFILPAFRIFIIKGRLGVFKAHQVTCLQKGLEMQNVKCYDVVRTPNREKEGSWGWYLRPLAIWLLLTSHQTHLSPQPIQVHPTLVLH